jgi:chromosome segregation ATPase
LIKALHKFTTKYMAMKAKVTEYKSELAEADEEIDTLESRIDSLEAELEGIRGAMSVDAVKWKERAEQAEANAKKWADELTMCQQRCNDAEERAKRWKVEAERLLGNAQDKK